jgi:DNA-binding MarR family transcriptional regulator
MERVGLIQRREDPSDARVVHVEMTAKGRRVLGKGRDLRIADIEGRVRRLDPRDIATLESAVGIIEGMLRD